MNISRRTLSALALSCMIAAAARAGTTPVNLPLPGGTEVPAVLEVIDESTTNWKPLPVAVTLSADGFNASVTTPSGTSTVEGKFEKQDKSVRCSVKWDGASEVADTFMMLTLIFPVDQVSDALVTSGEQSISFSKLINGEPARGNFNQVASFTMGPVGNQQIAFACEQPLDVGVVIMKDKDFAHVRLGLTPRKSALPSSGQVAWTMND